MSYAIISVIYGVPLNHKVREKIDEWKDEGDERYREDREGNECGFQRLYSAEGGYPYGYCGIQIGELKTYTTQKVSSVRTIPTPSEKEEVIALVGTLDPTLRKLAGEIDTYFIWHDS